MAIVKPADCIVLCDATVELISRHLRPYLFNVTVIGKPPHSHRREYHIAASTDSSAAMKGIELFQKEMSHPFQILDALGSLPTLQ